MKKNIVPMKKLYSATLALLVAICLPTLLITACAEINQTSRVTGVTLEHISDAPEDVYELIFNSELLDLKRDVEREGYSIILGKNPYQRHALADLDGNLLTDYEFFGGMKANYGLIEAEKISEDSNLTAGVLTQAGQVVVPFQYFAANALGSRWGVGFYTEEVSEDQEHDYYSIFTEDKHYYTITQADIYYFDGNEGRLVATLDRQGYAEAQGRGDYLNLIAREPDGKYYYNGAIAYDSDFNPVWTELHTISDFSGVMPAPVASFYDKDSGLYGLNDAEGSPILEPSMEFISSTVYDLVEFRQGDARGLLGQDGNVVLPAEFGAISVSAVGPLDDNGETVFRYNCLGYFTVGDADHEKGGYAVAGGEITCPLTLKFSSMHNGVATSVQNEDKSWSLVAADGVRTDLGPQYSYISALGRGWGMLWEASRDGGGYDLLDWHGQPLLSNCRDLTLTADGTVLAARSKDDDILALYRVTYSFAD